MPTPYSSSSTKKATSADSGVPAPVARASVKLAVATPTSRPERTATKERTPGSCPQMTSTKASADARLWEKKRR